MVVVSSMGFHGPCLAIGCCFFHGLLADMQHCSACQVVGLEAAAPTLALGVLADGVMPPKSARGRGGRGSTTSRSRSASAGRSSRSTWLPELPRTEAVDSRGPCATCGKRGSGCQFHSICGPGGTSHLACADCSTNYLEFFGHLPIDEVVAMKERGDGRIEGMLDEARSNIELPENRAFYPQQVSQLMGKTISIERKAIIVNAKEFKEVFGVEALAKHCRYLKTMQVPSEDGDGLEQVYLFKWQPTHLRTICLTQYYKVVTNSELLAASSHMYADQADDAFGSYSRCLDDRHGSANLKVQLPSLASVAEKLGAQPLEAAPSGAQAFAAAPGASPRISPNQDDRDPSPGGSSGAWEGAAARASPATKLSALPAKRGGAAVPVSAPAVAKRLHFDSGEASGKSSQSGEQWESSTSYSKGLAARGMLPDPGHEVQKWIQRLDLTEVLLARTGVQKHHAEKAEFKLRSKGFEEDAKRLREHLKLVSLAELLHADRVATTDEAELNAAIATLSRKLAFPGQVQRSIVQRAVGKLGRMVPDVATFKKVLHIAWPWGHEDGSKPSFDPKNPTCSSMELEMEEKIELFCSCFWKGPVTRSINNATSQDELLEGSLLHMLSLVEGVAARSIDMEQHESSLCCELMSCCRGLGFLVRPSLLLREGDIESALKDTFQVVDSTDASETYIMQHAALAVEGSEHLCGNIEVLRTKKVNLKELHPVMTKHFEALKGITTMDINGACCALEQALGDAPRVMHGLGDALKTAFGDFILAGVRSVSELMVQSQQCEQNQLQVVTKMLAEAANIFPMDSDIVDWASELGTRLAKVTHKTTMETFLQETSDIEDETSLLMRIADVEGALKQLEGVPFSTQAKDKTKDLLVLLFKACLQNLQEEVLEGLVAFGRRLIQLMPASELPEEASHLDHVQLAVHLSKATLGLSSKAVLGDGSVNSQGLAQAGASEELASLQQKYTELNATVKHAEEQGSDLKQLGCVTSEAKRLIDLLSQFELHAMEESCNTIWEKLQDVAGGARGGGCWVDALTEQAKQDWPALLKVARKTIMNESSVAGMRSQIEELEKAPHASPTKHK